MDADFWVVRGIKWCFGGGGGGRALHLRTKFEILNNPHAIHTEPRPSLAAMASQDERKV